MSFFTPKAVFIAAALLLVVAGLALWGLYATLIAGTTSGPDVIRALRSGSVRAETISSIEVVEPMLGSMPFTAKEYDSLSRRGKFDSAVTIGRLLPLLASAQPGRVQQNHPVSTNEVYLKLNTGSGFFWVYCKVLRDPNGSLLVLDANHRDATNPNGASTYHLRQFAELLGILEGVHNTEPGGAATRSRPVGAETNRTSAPPGSGG